MPSNAWTRFRYSIWAPHYDRVTRFPRERQRAVALLEPRPGERLLVIGCGTGADLPFLPERLEVLAIDLTPAMIRQAMAHARPGIEFRVMDGMALDLPDGSFDAAILHMVLEVIPDPARCLAEAARVLRVGGRLSIFDKFVPEGVHYGPLRRAGLALIDFVFTTTNQRMEEILVRSGAPFAVERDEPSVASYRHLILRRV
jgi:phosphatidylethanolamine/phosphatidyl-N-methylethanolamine N-methyltransferase